MFNLTLLQSLSFEGDVSSSRERIGNFEWLLSWGLQTNNRTLNIFTYPHHRTIYSAGDWSVEVDIKGKVGSTRFTKKNVKLNSETHNGEQMNNGEIIFEKDEETFLKEYETPEKTVLVSIEVSNIRTTGLRKFPSIDFEKSFSGSSDSTITIKDKTIHSHSQILSFSSTIFRGMIEKMTPPYVITLEDSIVYEDFLELLHHIYHPAEVIDGSNLKTILPLAKQFKAPQILELCQRFLEKYLSDSSVDKNSKIEYFLSAWINDIEPLKTNCVDFLFPWNELSLPKLLDKQLYQDLKMNQKLELLECLIMSSKASLQPFQEANLFGMFDFSRVPSTPETERRVLSPFRQGAHNPTHHARNQAEVDANHLPSPRLRNLFG